MLIVGCTQAKRSADPTVTQRSETDYVWVTLLVVSAACIDTTGLGYYLLFLVIRPFFQSTVSFNCYVLYTFTKHRGYKTSKNNKKEVGVSSE